MRSPLSGKDLLVKTTTRPSPPLRSIAMYLSIMITCSFRFGYRCTWNEISTGKVGDERKQFLERATCMLSTNTTNFPKTHRSGLIRSSTYFRSTLNSSKIHKMISANVVLKVTQTSAVVTRVTQRTLCTMPYANVVIGTSLVGKVKTMREMECHFQENDDEL